MAQSHNIGIYFCNSIYRIVYMVAVKTDNQKEDREMNELTSNEIIALKLCLNYDDRTSQLNDNFSNGGADEFCDALGWNKKQAGGLMSSLEQKGMGFADSDGYDIFHLTEKGVNAIFDIIESEK